MRVSPSLLALAAGLFSVLTVSCSSYQIEVRDGPPAAPLSTLPPNAGRICVLRPHQVASLVPAVVRDNGHLVGMTQGPTYFCYFVEPGFHSIVTRYGDDVDAKLGTDDEAEATMLVAPGGRYFLHHDVTKIMTLSVRWEDPTKANELLRECEYADLTSAPSDERLPGQGEVIPAYRHQ